MDSKTLEKEFSEFIKRTEFVEHKFPVELKLQLSEACMILKESYNSGWLFDMILFFRLTWRKVKLPIQIWSFSRLTDGRLRVSCDDETGNHLFGQSLNAGSFPFEDMRILVMENHVICYGEIYQDEQIKIMGKIL